jgi:glutamyl-tRNA synthetase
MVLGKDKARLSKRHGAMSVTAYRDMGYLPEAFINYMVRLGWSHGDQEFFTRKELIRVFDIKNIGRSAGVFDIEKLQAVNADHIQAAKPGDLVDALKPFMAEHAIRIEPGEYINNVIKTLQPRSKTLADMADASRFYFTDDIVYEDKAARKFLKSAALEPLRLLADKLACAADFSEKALEDVFKSVMAATGLKLGKIAQPVRVALTGKTASPGIFEIIAIIGKDRVLQRLEKAVAFIENRVESDEGG